MTPFRALNQFEPVVRFVMTGPALGSISLAMVIYFLLINEAVSEAWPTLSVWRIVRSKTIIRGEMHSGPSQLVGCPRPAAYGCVHQCVAKA